VYFIVSCLLSVYSRESNARGMVPKLSQWQALPWDAKQTYITVMNLATCFQEHMQFALNKKLEYCGTTMCTVPIKGPSRLFGCTYNCTTVYEFSFQEKIRVCQDKYWCSCLLNLNVQFQKIFTLNTHSWPVFRNSKLKYWEERALIEKKPPCGV